MKTIKVVAAIIIEDNKLMVAKRGYGKYKGLYEFVGGKVESNETNEEALIREVKEELNANIEVIKFYMNVKYQYEDFNLDMETYLCKLKSNNINLIEHDEVIFVDKDELSKLEIIKADIAIVNKLIIDKLI